MTNSKPLGQANYEQFADRFAALIDTKAYNAHYERPATLSLLPDITGMRILDAGCGTGTYTEWLLAQGADYVEAVDVTPAFVAMTHQRLASQFPAERFSVHQADLAKPLSWIGDALFDVVLCPLVLDYVEDWHGPFGEFKRVLKSGGIFIFSVPHPMMELQFSTSGDYFAVELYEVVFHSFGEPYPVMKAYRRPLANMVNTILAAGLELDKIVEPLPTAEFATMMPASYTNLLKSPAFIHFRAKKR